MATFKRLSDSFYSIQRSEKAQSLLFPRGIIPELFERLGWCVQEGLKRLEDTTLPDTDTKVGDKIICRVTTASDSGVVRIDIREWYTTLTGSLNPTRRGVNLSLELLTIVYSEVEDFVKKEKEALFIDATRNALHASPSTSSTAVVTDEVDNLPELPGRKKLVKEIKRKLTVARKGPAPKKTKAAPKKGKKKTPQPESEDEECAELSASSEEIDSD
jgi:hypothetical protein